MKKVIIILIITLVVAFFTYRIIKPQIFKKPQPETSKVVEEAPKVKVVKVKSGNLLDILTITGTIEANISVKVSSKLPGEIERIYYEEGDYVKKGAPLLKLETDELYAQKRQAEAQLKAAEAQLQKVKAGAREQEREQVEQNVKQAEVNLDNAEKELTRMKKLYEDGVIPEQTLDKVKLAYEVAKAQYKTAIEAKSLINEGAREEDKKAVEAQVAQAKAALSLIETQINNCIIRSPITGIIAMKTAEVGETVAPGIPIFQIIDISKVKVKVGISERKISQIKLGQQVRVKVDAYKGKTFYGKVDYISPAANMMTKLFEVKILVPNKGNYLKPGMFADAQIIIAQKAAALIVPKQALLTREGRDVVFLHKNGYAKEVEVKTGIVDDKKCEILFGIKPNDEIVIEGNYELEDGMRVKIVK